MSTLSKQSEGNNNRDKIIISREDSSKFDNIWSCGMGIIGYSKQPFSAGRLHTDFRYYTCTTLYVHTDTCMHSVRLSSQSYSVVFLSDFDLVLCLSHLNGCLLDGIICPHLLITNAFNADCVQNRRMQRDMQLMSESRLRIPLSCRAALIMWA